jgi:uncharacterized protein (DUF2147 family)
MRRIVRRLVGLGAVVAAALAFDAHAQTDDPSSPEGYWRNAHNSVHLHSYFCGDHLCAKIAWANPRAIADAKAGGTPNLIGTDIFREFGRDTEGVWRGQVYVPDIQRTFSGSLRFTPNVMTGTGCLIGRILCKTSIWTRIPAP